MPAGYIRFYISTHSLTRRLTACAGCGRNRQIYFNSQPHKEADEADRWIFNDLFYFNSQPHKEADQSSGIVFHFNVHFNSQPHKEADSVYTGIDAKREISTHSLTRRLTVMGAEDHVCGNNFNSQPHKEADSNFRQKHIYPKLIFLLIIHISLIFYSNHHILNYFSCKLYVFPGANVLEYFCELTFRTIILRYL